MKKILLISTAVFFITNSITISQVNQEWVKTYNGSGNNNDVSFAIVNDGLGNVIVTGRIYSTGNNADFGTIKYSASGVQQWAAIYNGTAGNFDQATGVATDNAGNVYVTGQVRNASLNYDIAVIKYSPAGTEQWVRIWDGGTGMSDVPAGIAVDNSGNICVTGYSEKTSSNVNYITIKYNTAGVLQWAKEYNNPVNSYDAAYFIKADSLGNVYVTGTSTAQGTGPDFLTIKYNAAGDSSWVRRFSGTTSINEIPQGFAVDRNGNVYVTGFSQGPSNSTDFATVKYNSAGVQQWAVFYDTTASQDIPEDLEVDGNGNVYVTGRTRINSGYNDIATIKYNSSGVRQWLTLYNNTANNFDDQGNDLAVDSFGNVYVAGHTNVDGSDYDALTIKYNPSGVEQWVEKFDMSTDDEANAITLDNNNNIYITGYTGISNSDFLTIKYSQSVGIHQISAEIPAQYSLQQNFPNPFNPKTIINYQMPNSNFVSLKVYDVLGNLIETLVNEKQSPGSYSFDFDGSGISSGVYFYKLETDDFTAVKKMMLIK